MNIDCCKSYVGKQIIGLLPNESSPTVCLWSTGQIYDFTCSGFSTAIGDWSWNGFVNDPNGYANSIGGHYVVDGYGGCPPFYTDIENAIQFYYVGTTPPPDLTVTDLDNNSTIYPWLQSACSFGCVQTPSIRLLNSPYGWLNMSGLLITESNPLNYGVPFDFAYPLDVQNTLNGIIASYQQTGSCELIDDGGGFYTIKFKDVYYNPTFLSNGLTLYYDITGSPTPEVISLSPC